MAKKEEQEVVDHFSRFNNLPKRSGKGGQRLTPEQIQELKETEMQAAKLRKGRGHRIKPGEGFVK